MDACWTLQELVAQVATRIGALPPPRNGQVRAIPDDRTVRYYATIGLLDRPAAMRGRTALYSPRHVAQVVAIKRLQAMGRSLSEIQTLWPTLDANTLARMSGVALEPASGARARATFWKHGTRQALPPGEGSAAAGAEPDEPDGRDELDEPSASMPGPPAPAPASVPLGPAPVAGPPACATAVTPPAHAPVELRLELAPGVALSLSITGDRVALSPADLRALRAAAAPLVAELASRRIAQHPSGEEP